MWLAIGSFYGSAIVFYIADALQKRTSIETVTWNYLGIRSLYTTIFSAVVTLAIFGIKDFPSTPIFLELMGCSILCGFGLFFYIKAINCLNFSNVGSLYIIGNVIQHIAGIILYKELFYYTDLLAFGLINAANTHQSKS